MKENLKKILIRNTVTNYIMLIVKIITGIIVTGILVMNLDKNLYGYWALMWSIFGYALLLDFGFGSSIQKYTAEVSVSSDYDEFNKLLSTVFGSYAFMSLIILIGSFSVAPYIDNIFDFGTHSAELISRYRIIFLIFGIGVALTFPLGIFAEVLKGLKRSDICNYIMISQTLLYFGGVYYIFEMYEGADTLFFLAVYTVALNVLTNLAMFTASRILVPEMKIKPKNFIFSKIKKITSFSLFAYLVMCANIIIFHTDKIVLGAMMSVGFVGIYQIASRVPFIVTKFANQFQDNLAPVAASISESGDKNRLKWVLLQSNKASVFLGTLIFLPTFFLVEEILNVWLDVTPEEYPGTMPIAYMLLASSYAITIFRSVTSKFLLMAGHHKTMGIIAISESLANIIFSIILIKLIGFIGIAVGTIIPNLIVCVIVFSLSNKFAGISQSRSVEKSYSPILLPLIYSAVFLYALSNFYPMEQFQIVSETLIPFISTRFSGLLYILMSGALSSIIFTLLAYRFFLDDADKNKLFQMLPEKIRRKIKKF